MRRDWASRRRYRHTEGSHFVGGAILLAVGVILLLDRLGIVPAGEIFQYWPMLIVAGALSMLFRPISLVTRVYFGVLVAAGLILQAATLGYLHVRGELFWPLVLIGFGIVLLGRALESHLNPPKEVTEPEQATGPAGPAWHPRAFRNVFGGRGYRGEAVFSGIQHRIAEQDFERARVSAVFGGFGLDLRPAGMKGDEAYVKADAVFGGIEIWVPENWDVIMRAQGVFGGVSDETKHPEPVAGVPPKRLIVRGAAVFGGIVVKNGGRSMWE